MIALALPPQTSRFGLMAGPCRGARGSVDTHCYPQHCRFALTASGERDQDRLPRLCHAVVGTAISSRPTLSSEVAQRISSALVSALAIVSASMRNRCRRARPKRSPKKRHRLRQSKLGLDLFETQRGRETAVRDLRSRVIPHVRIFSPRDVQRLVVSHLARLCAAFGLALRGAPGSPTEGAWSAFRPAAVSACRSRPANSPMRPAGESRGHYASVLTWIWNETPYRSPRHPWDSERRSTKRMNPNKSARGRRNQLEPRGKDDPAGGARDRDEAVLQRLPQRLERGSRELGQLVEEQHAAVREARLARTQSRFAADDRRGRRAVIARGTAGSRRADAPAVAVRRPSGRASPRAPPPDRAGAGCPAAATEHRLARAGGPPSSRLWPPAAAISSARRARSCPRTSARSGTTTGAAPFTGSTGSGSSSPRRYATASARWRTRTGSTPASAASAADSDGHSSRSSPILRAPSATASTPPTGRSRPSSASSPTDACRSSSSRGTCRDAASTASAIGRSKPEPSFRSSAGARLTVTRRRGNSSSADAMPLRTRSRASFSALSASPTIANDGTPSWMCASTSTRRGSRPTSAWVTARASTTPTLRSEALRQGAVFYARRRRSPATSTSASSAHHEKCSIGSSGKPTAMPLGPAATRIRPPARSWPRSASASSMSSPALTRSGARRARAGRGRATARHGRRRDVSASSSRRDVRPR